MSDADQTIKVQLIVETREGMKNLEENRKVINALKADLQALVNESAKQGKAFGTLGEQVKTAFKAEARGLEELINLWDRYNEKKTKKPSKLSGSTEPDDPEKSIQEENPLSDEDIARVLQFKQTIEGLGLSVEKFISIYRGLGSTVVEESQKAISATAKFDSSIVAGNASVAEAGVIFNQLSQAEIAARNDLSALIAQEKIAVGDTNALARAQQSLIDQYTKQQLAPFMEGGKIRAGAFGSEELAQAQKNIADYTKSVKAGVSETKKEWQDVAREHVRAEKEAERQNKETQDREKARVRAWQNEQKGFWKKSQGGMTSALPPAGWGADKTTEELKAMAMASNNTKSAFTSLGGVARTVFAGVLGITAVGAIRDFIQLLMKGVDAAIEFEKSNYLLRIGIRALQKVGLDATLNEWTASMQKFKEQFPVFNQQEIVGAFSVAILKLREYGATQEQINRILSISATLALAYGRDFQEMTNAVTGAITRGYFEALQSMGIAIGRINIMQDAMQEGLTGGLMALTEQERFKLAFNILDENVSMIEDDMIALGESGEASFIKIREAEAKSADAIRELGESFIKVKVAALATKAGILEFLASIASNKTASEEDVKRLEEIKTLQSQLAEKELEISKLRLEQYVNAEKVTNQLRQAGISEAEIAATLIEENFNYQSRIDGLSESRDLIKEQLKDLRNQLSSVELQNKLGWEQVEIQKQIKNTQRQLITRIKSDVTLSPEKKKELIDAANAIIDEAEANIERLKIEYELVPIEPAVKLPVDYAAAFTEMLGNLKSEWIKFKNAVEELDTQLNIDVAVEVDVESNIQKSKIQLDYEAELQKIEEDLANSIANAWSDYYDSLRKLDADYQRSLAQSQEDHRVEELRAEEEHLKDMRRLREDYLYDLEDALKERDAIAIIRLTREYNKEKKRREEDYADQKRQRDEDYERQRREREEEYRIRREELRYELQQRLELLRIEAEQRRAEALKQRDQAIADAKAQYELQKAELEKALQDQFNLQMDNLIKTLGLSQTELDTFFKNNTDVNSPMYKMWEAYREYARTANLDAINFLDQVLGRMGTVMYYFNVLKQMYMGINSGMFGPGFAEGGRYPVKTPVLVGEKGPELVVFDNPGEIIPADVTARLMKDMTVHNSVDFSGEPDMSATINRNDSRNYNTNISGNLSREDKVKIDVWLSPDLEGRIIDKTLDEAAGVVVDIVNRRR